MILRPIFIVAVLATAAISSPSAFAQGYGYQIPASGASTMSAEEALQGGGYQTTPGYDESSQGGYDQSQSEGYVEPQGQQVADPYQGGQTSSRGEVGLRALAGFLAEDQSGGQRPSLLSRLARAAACASGPCQ